MATDPVSPDLFETDDFWEAHKSKIIGYGALILFAIGGWGIYEYRQQANITASEVAFATASTADEFKAITEQYSGTPAAGNATLELADKLREEKKYDEAVALLRDFTAKNNSYPLIAGAWVSLASTLELQGKLSEAAAVYQEIVTKFPQESAAPLALSSQARLLAREGDIEAAKRTYQDLSVRYPESIYAVEGRRELQLLEQGAPQAPTASEAPKEAPQAEGTEPPTPEAEAAPATE